MTSSPIDREIIITRHMKAPQRLVWKACTEPEHIDRWWGPDGFTNRTIRMDFRVGGEWEYTMTGPDGKVWPNLITYREIEPFTRLFYDHGAPGAPKQFEAELRFEVNEGGTLVTLRTVFPSKEARDFVVENVGAIEGGKQTLAHLDAYTEELGSLTDVMDTPTFYHGTKADLKPGDLIQPGYRSNYGQQKKANYVYFTATMDAAIGGAELAQGEGRGKIYIVVPSGPYEDDPNLTDKKFPGNPTKSYRTKEALRVVGEVKDWQGHAPVQLQTMKDHLQRLKDQGIEAIEG
jgi:uncharacterized protein YndB with AHSA1/START domain